MADINSNYMLNCAATQKKIGGGGGNALGKNMIASVMVKSIQFNGKAKS